MLVFVTHPYHRGGVTSWIKEAVIACSRLGIAHRLVTVRPEKPFISGGLRPVMTEFVGSGVNLAAATVDWRFELGTMEYRASIYASLIAPCIEKDTVLIPSDDEACWRACSMLSDRCRVVGVLHSDDDNYYALAARYHQYLAGLVSVSQRVRSNCPDYGLPHAVIPCGIDLSQFEASTDKQDKVLWIGRLEENQKRVSDLPLIAALLMKTRPEVSIEVIGHGDKLDWLKEAIHSQGLVNLSISGWQERSYIATSLREAKVLLQTSNFEGMSVAVMEALGAGCKVVSTRVSGVEDMEHDPASKGVVYLYDTGDVENAALMIDHCLRYWQPLNVFQATTLAEKYFSIEECLQSYLEFSKAIKSVNLQPRTKGKVSVTISSTFLAAMRLLKYNLSAPAK